MTTRQQWLRGLEWGACAWLTYVAARTTLDVVWPTWQIPFEGWDLPSLHSAQGFAGGTWLTAVLWLTALTLVAAGSRLARLGIAVAILAQAVIGAMQAVGHTYAPREPAYVAAFVLSLFLPMCLPLLPLVVLRVEEPRLVLALATLGRWREARARFGGLGPLAVALALLSLHAGANGLLQHIYYGSTARDLARGIYDGLRPLGGWTFPAPMFALAMLIVWATSRARRQAST